MITEAERTGTFMGLRSTHYRGKRYMVGFLSCLLLLLVTVDVTQARTRWPRVVLSKDGTPISYEGYGSGDPTPRIRDSSARFLRPTAVDIGIFLCILMHMNGMKGVAP